MIDVSSNDGVGRVQNLEGTKLCDLNLFSGILPVQSYYTAAVSYGPATR
jgi:hypothetical protein